MTKLKAMLYGVLPLTLLGVMGFVSYNYFAPGGALSCAAPCTSQTVDLSQTGSVLGPLRVGAGGTGTNTALTGVVRGGSPLTASELSGDMITSGSNATTIQANVVTNAKLAQVPATTLKGNNTAGVTNVLDLTVAQVQSLLAVPPPANPTASAGPVAVNGTAATYMRSDAAPAINQAATFAWTGPHTWTEALGTTALTVNANGSVADLLLTGNVNGGIFASINNASTGTGASSLLTYSNGSHAAALELLGPNNTQGEGFRNGCNCSRWDVTVGGSNPHLSVTEIAGVPKVQGRGPAAAALVDMTPDTATVTFTASGCTTAPTGSMLFYRVGQLVTARFPAISCTSTGSAVLGFAGTFPTSMAPTSIENYAAIFTNNGATTLGVGQITTTGFLFFLPAATPLAGTVGIPVGNLVSYLAN